MKGEYEAFSVPWKLPCDIARIQSMHVLDCGSFALAVLGDQFYYKGWLMLPFSRDLAGCCTLTVNGKTLHKTVVCFRTILCCVCQQNQNEQEMGFMFVLIYVVCKAIGMWALKAFFSPSSHFRVVEFASYGDLKNAIEKLSGKEINGRKIKLIEGSKRHRSRSRSRSRTRSSSRSRSRSRSRRSKSYSRSRSRSRSRSKSRSGSRSPVPEKSQKRGSSSRSKSPASVDRQRSRSRSRSRSVDSGN